MIHFVATGITVAVWGRRTGAPRSIAPRTKRRLRRVHLDLNKESARVAQCYPPGGAMIPSRVILPLCGIFLSAAVMAQGQAPPTGQVATFVTGEKMLNACTGEGAVLANCVGYAIGVADAASVASAAGGNIRGFRVCLPPGGTGTQILGIILQFLDAHPAERQYSAAALAVQALAAAWPCP